MVLVLVIFLMLTCKDVHGSPIGNCKIIVKLRQGSGKDRQGMALDAKGPKA